MKTYRAVLIGTGSIGDAHVRAVEDTQGRVTLDAAVDIDAKRVADFAGQHKIPRHYTDYATMLKAERPDIVLIATPPAQHASMSIAAMEAGAWVLCEKPLCGSLAELDSIEAAEQRTGCFTSCIFQMRFGSSTAHVRRLADQGQLGQPSSASATHSGFAMRRIMRCPGGAAGIRNSAVPRWGSGFTRWIIFSI